ncbi:hypothetical protein BM1_00299 [Bipolaris maydis]|nr:hypothetical protein BM1_00299 [Bipolaris maydis]
MGQRTGKAARRHSVVDGGGEAWGAWEADWVTDVQQQQMKPAERDQLQGGLEAGEAIAGKARAAAADRGGGQYGYAAWRLMVDDSQGVVGRVTGRRLGAQANAEWSRAAFFLFFPIPDGYNMDSRARWQASRVCAWRRGGRHMDTQTWHLRLSSSNSNRRGDVDGEHEGVDSVDWMAVIQLPQQWGPFACTWTCHAAVESRCSRPLLVGHGHACTTSTSDKTQQGTADVDGPSNHP